MSKRKKDPSKTGLSSSHIQGQGTTTTETGAHKLDSARKKTKQ
ncbi:MULTISPECIES: YuzL family protein [Anoxybacillaceae]|nr:YuzL family protein [Anoxybacillus sp. P3H1B]